MNKKLYWIAAAGLFVMVAVAFCLDMYFIGSCEMTLQEMATQTFC